MKIKINCTGTELITLDKFIELQGNLKTLSKENYNKLKNSILKYGFSFPVFCWLNNNKHYILDAHQRINTLKELQKEGYEVPALPTVFIEAENRKQAKELLLQLNSNYGKITDEGLYEFINEIGSELDFEEIKKGVELIGIDFEKFEMEYNEDTKDKLHKKLIDLFLVPPFSIFDTKQGYWQDRKKQWLSLGIKSELGRDKDLTFGQESINKIMSGKGIETGTSIFDPVLCELCYSWFCVPKGRILDLFAGGSVRGIVACFLGFEYLGIDLNEMQIKENKKQANTILKKERKPKYIIGDTESEIEEIKNNFDLIFTCPPYFDLEKYVNDRNDLSNLSYEEFCAKYEKILSKGIKLLKNNSFGIIVISDIRDNKGFYRDLTGLTKNIFLKNGMCLYNEIILCNTCGSLPIRIIKYFEHRKIGKVHQNILIFFKGNTKEIKMKFNRKFEFDKIFKP
jgi:16S rRNA G966 N2-methylase RsmD